MKFLHNLFSFLISARERKLLAENARLRAGLRFYAEQEHMILQDWEEPDDPGWLCPPSKEDIEEHYGKEYDGLPWMVEDGGVARIILRGGKIEKVNGELVARMDPRPRAEEYRRTLIPCFKFEFGDLPLILRQTDSVSHLASVFGMEPRALQIEPVMLTRAQLRAIPDWQ